MIRTLKIHQVFGHVNAYRVEDEYQESLDSLRAQLTGGWNRPRRPWGWHFVARARLR